MSILRMSTLELASNNGTGRRTRCDLAAVLLVLMALVAGCGGGSAPALKPGPMPADGDFTGVWHSAQYGEMHMLQEGSSVHGRYEADQRTGKITGEVDGDLMRFEWKEQKALVANRPNETVGHGYFRYIVKDNGEHRIEGRWGLDADDRNGGEWSAYKMKNREPDLGESSGGEDDGAPEDVEVSDDDLF